MHKKFNILNQLGQGSYSKVYKVQRLEDGNDYALKLVSLKNIKEKDKINALNEVRLLASIRHPNIVSYKEAFIDHKQNSLCIVMELCENGDLSSHIRQIKARNGSIPQEQILNMIHQIASALKTLHELKVLHRDIKSANVFLGSDGSYKLADLNISKVAKAGFLQTQTGTPFYASPEVWKDQPYDNKSDIWSLGCLAYEMAALEPPFLADDMNELYKKVIKGYYKPLPLTYSAELNALIRMMLQINSTLRPTAVNILQQPYFSDLQSPRQQRNKLLRTIQFKKDLTQLSLPKPNYKLSSDRVGPYRSPKAKSILADVTTLAISPSNIRGLLSDRKIIKPSAELIRAMQQNKLRQFSYLDAQKLPQIETLLRHQRNCSLPIS